MMASLIHTNRESTTIAADPVSGLASSSSASDSRPPSKRSRRQFTLDESFRPKLKDPDELETDDEDENENARGGKGRGVARGPTATLVVAPVSLMDQWKGELLRSAKKGSLNVFGESFSLVQPSSISTDVSSSRL